MPSLTSLHALLLDELQDIYSAETQLIKALPKMAKAATNPDLKAGFTDHLEQTRGHAERLEKIGKILDFPLKGKTCEAMKGLIAEGGEAIEADAPDAVRDAQLIGAAQRVEHYEMAAYGTARAFAETLGHDEVATLLQDTLDEEGDANKLLMKIAWSVNAEALAVAE